MKNFIFISPNFPTNYWQFCKELKNNGLNVLGIGDQPYDELKNELKENLTEYYKVNSLENEDEVYRAVAFFAYKYGRIDWLESNNEYWLEKDAALRTDFHITSGFQIEDMERIKYKSKMKEYYKKAGIPVARYHMVDDKAGCLAFVNEVGYPVIAKPDNGVGASDTHKIVDEESLDQFMEKKHEGVPYIMEEFIDAEIESYDAVINSEGEPLFETGNVTPFSIMDIVNTNDNSRYHIVKELAEDVREAGRKTVKSFGVKSRFVHFEFFRLLKDHEGMGKKGDVVALEVNMRPCGGFSPDMMNYAHSTDVYKIWADMIAFDECTLVSDEHAFCAYAGRRDGKEFALSDADIMEKYGASMKMRERIPEALSGAMGNQMYVARFETAEEMEVFYADVFKVVEGKLDVEETIEKDQVKASVAEESEVDKQAEEPVRKEPVVEEQVAEAPVEEKVPAIKKTTAKKTTTRKAATKATAKTAAKSTTKTAAKSATKTTAKSTTKTTAKNATKTTATKTASEDTAKTTAAKKVAEAKVEEKKLVETKTESEKITEVKKAEETKSKTTKKAEPVKTAETKISSAATRKTARGRRK